MGILIKTDSDFRQPRLWRGQDNADRHSKLDSGSKKILTFVSHAFGGVRITLTVILNSSRHNGIRLRRDLESKIDHGFSQDDTFVKNNQLPWLRKLFPGFSFIFTDGIMLLVFKFAMLAWLSWQSASFTSMRSLVQIQARAPIFIKFISPKEMGLT